MLKTYKQFSDDYSNFTPANLSQFSDAEVYLYFYQIYRARPKHYDSESEKTKHKKKTKPNQKKPNKQNKTENKNKKKTLNHTGKKEFHSH